MGWETARCIAEDGGNVVMVARDVAFAAQRAEQLTSEYRVRAIGLHGDGTVAGSVEAAVEQAISELGPIRGTVVTTGLTFSNGTLLEMTDADWDRTISDVLLGTVRPCKAILPHMIANGGGNIVTTAAYSARAPKSFLFGYSALKAAVVNFTKNLANTYGADGIRANCVAPGAVRTERVEASIEDARRELGLPDDEAEAYVMTEKFKMPVGLRRAGSAREIAEIMTFLVSERGAYATGVILNADGGTNF